MPVAAIQEKSTQNLIPRSKVLLYVIFYFALKKLIILIYFLLEPFDCVIEDLEFDRPQSMDDSSRPTALMQLLRDMAHDKRPSHLSYRSTLQTPSSSAFAPLKRNYFPLPSLPSLSSAPEPARRAFHCAMEHPFISSFEKRPTLLQPLVVKLCAIKFLFNLLS